MSADPNRPEPCLERRGSQRFELYLPLAVHFEGRTVPGYAQNLTGRGIFFYAEAEPPEGAVVELTFTMPAEITFGENMPVRCRGRVLRAAGDSQAGQRTGIAARLDSYQYLPCDEPISQLVRVSGATDPGETAGPIPR